MLQSDKLELNSLTNEELQNLNQVVNQLITASFLIPDAQVKVLIKSGLLASYLNFSDFQHLLRNASYEIEHTFRQRMRLP